MTRPAKDLADLQSRPIRERLLLPPLVVLGSKCWQAQFKGMEATVYAYRFAIRDVDTWTIDYLGRYHWGWDAGKELLLVATIKSHSRQWRCTKISRPVEQRTAETPLFTLEGLAR